MLCQAKTANGNPCKSKAKQYGVCSRHWAKACSDDGDPRVAKFLEELKPIYLELRDLVVLAEKQGLNILAIQPSFHNNLTQGQGYKLSNPLLQRIAECYVEARQCINKHRGWERYNSGQASKEEKLFFALIANIGVETGTQILTTTTEKLQ